MKESNELFELCRQVYEATGWMPVKDQYLTVFEKDGDKCLWVYDNCCWRTLDDSEEDAGYVPLYTSDYLLEKLPSVVQDPHDKIFRHIQMWINGDRSAHAGYVEPYAHDDRVAYAQKSDEMRITLLKLTLKLHEENLI